MLAESVVVKDNIVGTAFNNGQQQIKFTNNPLIYSEVHLQIQDKEGATDFQLTDLIVSASSASASLSLARTSIFTLAFSVVVAVSDFQLRANGHFRLLAF